MNLGMLERSWERFNKWTGVARCGGIEVIRAKGKEGSKENRGVQIMEGCRSRKPADISENEQGIV